MVLNSLIGVNGVLLLIVLSFAFISITVRGPDFSKNSFNNLLKTSEGYFTINTKTEGLHSEAISLHPEISIPLDMNFGGDYLSAGDLTGDGIVEIVSAKYWVEPLDKNRIKSIVVQSLLTDSLTGEKGKVLWSWESQYPAPKKIGSGRGSSAAIAVFDLQTGEANKKLLFATDGWLYEITFGENGFVSEKKVPTGSINSADCLIIANLDGTGKHYLLLKDAYHNIWAFDMNLNLLWKTKNPGGYLLAHRIAACDINRDGTDEILAGATMLNNKGEVIRTLKTNSVELWYGGHIDGIVPIIQNNELSIAVTYCDGLGFALFDSEGKLKWEVTDEHFEYLVGGYFFNTPELNKQFQLISKVHYDAKNPQVMMNQDGKLLGIFKPSSTVFSADWTGDGYHEMIFLSPASVYQGTKKIADLFVPGTEYNNAHILRVADVWGTISLKPDGIPDVILKSIDEDNTHFLHIYPNLKGKKPVNYVYPGIGWESSANYFTKYYEYKR